MYALNIADWICTVALLRTGGFFEANPLMRTLIGEPLSGLVAKCLLPGALLISVYLITRGLDGRALSRVDRFVCFVLALYSALCAIHILNIIIWQMIR